MPRPSHNLPDAMKAKPDSDKPPVDSAASALSALADGDPSALDEAIQRLKRRGAALS